MKFTKGYWLMREGLDAYFPVHLHDLGNGQGLHYRFCATKTSQHQGDTLNCELLTVQYSSPMEDVIRVGSTTIKGDRIKLLNLRSLSGPIPKVEIQEDEDYASLTSGRLKVRISKKGRWGVDFLGDGRIITRSEDKALGYIETRTAKPMSMSNFPWASRRTYTAPRERFTAFVKNGQARGHLERGREEPPARSHTRMFPSI